MLINDVGEVTWEEINDGFAGRQLRLAVGGRPRGSADPSFVDPRYSYDHGGGRCAITGGAFYSPSTVMFPGGLRQRLLLRRLLRWLDPAARHVDQHGDGLRDRHQRSRGLQGLRRTVRSTTWRAARGGLPRRATARATGIANHPAHPSSATGRRASTFTVVASGAAVHVSVAAQRQQHRSAPPRQLHHRRRSSGDNGARFRVRGRATTSATCSATRRC